jgi:HPt (histidine-containing phosphotransfer) domain-containing protein
MRSIIQEGDPLEPTSTKFLIRVPQGIPRELVAEYLERCRSGLPHLDAAVDQNQHDHVRMLGHRMKGTGTPYGFPRLTEIGAGIEQAATDQNSDALRLFVAELEEYLSRVEIAGE